MLTDVCDKVIASGIDIFLKLVFLRNKYSAFKVVFRILGKIITNRAAKENTAEREAEKHFLQTHPVRQ